MSDLTKLKISWILFSTTFWMSVVNLYYEYRGLSVAQFFTLVSIYSIANVVLEFPTGVFGDHYSHRFSVAAGTLIFGLSILGLALKLDFYGYLLFFLAAAFGMTMVSGSDNALLYSLSADYKKERGQIAFHSLIWSALTIIVGPFLAKINLALPSVITGIFCVISSLFIFAIKKPEYKKDAYESNIFGRGLYAINTIFKKGVLLKLMLISFLVGGFFNSLKYLYNPMLISAGIKLEYWGIIISILTLIHAYGSKKSVKIKIGYFHWTVLFISFSVFLSGLTSISYIVLLAFVALHLFRGIFSVQIEAFLAANANDSTRASILSAGTLFVRLGASLFYIVIGNILTYASFSYLMLLMGVVLFFSFLISAGLAKTL